MSLTDMNKDQLNEMKAKLTEEYVSFKNKGLKLDMSRGKPSSAQLDLSMGMMDCLSSITPLKAADGTDCRNYGVLDGIAEAKEMFSQMIDVGTDEIIIGGNSSLNIMYDVIFKAMLLGVYGGSKPWGKYDEVKFLCPVPGYDRHFAICESLGIKMINVPLNSDGPDMDMVEKLVASDETIKGIWCVPMYSNPDGVTYSDEVVKRFANFIPKADDFRIFWDNAYAIHHLTDTPDKLLNIFEECKKAGNPDMVYIFGSTSKVSLAGSGIAMLGASKANIDYIKKQLTIQTIGSDKINQLRHVKFFKDFDGILAQMEKHKAIIAPKFEAVLKKLDEEIAPLDIASWHKPNGGYFISFNTMDGCAKRVIQLCKEAGVVLTPAGATFPYGKDPFDKNIRIAPTFPPVSELETAMELFCICVKLASVEKLIG